jgi:hypothetical protein
MFWPGLAFPTPIAAVCVIRFVVATQGVFGKMQIASTYLNFSRPAKIVDTTYRSQQGPNLRWENHTPYESCNLKSEVGCREIQISVASECWDTAY